MKNSRPQQRSYSLFGLALYVAGFAVGFGILRLLAYVDWQWGMLPAIEALITLLGLAVVVFFGAFIGVGVELALGNRRQIIRGGTMGAVILPVLLLVCFAVVVQNTTVNHPRIVDSSAGPGLKQQIEALRQPAKTNSNRSKR